MLLLRRSFILWGNDLSTAQPVIEVKNLRKSLDGHEILAGIDLVVERAETVVIIGESGGGKSVLLRHIMGLTKPDVGEIWIDGVEITSMGERALDEIRLRMGMLFQEAALFDSMNVFENVAFPLREHYMCSEDEIERKVHVQLDQVGMMDSLRLYPEQLSGGMKKRVGLARALIMEPKMMLYDEPTSGIDLMMRGEINALINKLNELSHVAALVVTHDIESALDVGDRIALLEGGVIVASGTPAEIAELDDPIAHRIKRELSLKHI